MPWDKDGYSQRLPDGQPAPFVAHFAGPILLTAPHGLRVYRGGLNGERRRLHGREKYVTQIVLKVAALLRKRLGIEASFIVWNYKTARPKDSKNLDPNYLVESQFARSPWHQSLQTFKQRFFDKGKASLHIDFHGKKNRKSKVHNVDIGIDPLLECCKDPEDCNATIDWSASEASKLQAMTASILDKAFAKASGARGKHIQSNPDPYLCGLWGHGCEHTLSHQAVRIGIPAFQLETPSDVRTKMMMDNEFLNKFANAIADIYEKVVVPIEKCHDRVQMKPSPACGDTKIIHNMIDDIAKMDSKKSNIGF